MKRILLILSLFLCSNLLPAQHSFTKLFGDSLYTSKDYFRAITEYKRLYYASNDPMEKMYALWQIARSYHFSNKYKLSLKYLNKMESLSPVHPWQCDASLLKGLNYMGLHTGSHAFQYLDEASHCDNTGKSVLFKSILYTEIDNFQKARLTLKDFSSNFKESPFLSTALRMDQILAGEHKLPRKSPTLATVMSIVIPGSGQIYTEHYYDGLMAFIYVASFSYATYMAYHYDKDHQNNYANTIIGVSVTSLFHLGNIIGANRTAHYYNYRQKQMLLNEIRDLARQIPY
ncbi:MAG: hypothetical protein Kow00108_01830 [Calditrichia bacterium]